MENFNTFTVRTDTAFYRDLCLTHGQLKHFKRNELIAREGEVSAFIGYMRQGIMKYTCTNHAEHKVYNVGFSFTGELVADYPTCLYSRPSQLNMQAITACDIYVCPATFFKEQFELQEQGQRIARIAAEELFFQSYARYLDMFRLTPEERYLQLLRRCPEILQLLSLKEIASYLKITPVHMSRIRARQLQRSF